ncbi:hypothetical protein AB0B25_30880 [Nocardia sp. NPDC049190]|uniref:hypothetical protein n=1 Tax=Nocardia sp. NPDC049190 TaxID=3155650 RepID=UPI003400F6E1
MRSGRSLVEYYGSQYSLQLYLGVAVLYIATNFLISLFAKWLTSRQQHSRRSKSTSGTDIPLTPTRL